MRLVIRPFKPEDRKIYFEMSKKFHSPPAALCLPSDAVLLANFDAATENPENVKGYFLEYGGEPAGYSIVSMKFETEVGGTAAWIEELYIDEKFRGRGLGTEFLGFVRNRFRGEIKRLRLEVGDANEAAKRLYARLGFRFLEYRQMVIDGEI